MKPILSKKTSYAFDANNEHTFEFTIHGYSNQAVANQLIIRDNETNNIVYSNRQDTFQLKHIIPGNTLTNGCLYNVVVYIIDKNNNESEISNPVLFYCYTTPTFNLDLEAQDNIIESSSISLSVEYNQLELEELQMFKIQLFDSQKMLLSTSGIKYQIDKPITFNGLLDNTSYYVKGFGQTINHMELETDYIPFVVNYIAPSFYSYCLAENRYNLGDIQISSNLISIEGKCNNEIYIDNSFIDTINGSNVYFDEGFNLNDNFTLYLNGYNFQYNEKLLSLIDKDNINNLSLYWRKNKNKYYIELNVNYNQLTYVIYSNEISCSPTDIINIWIKRIKQYYSIAIDKDNII